MAKEIHNFVSRGGLKMQAALDAFNLDVTDFTCADLGANVGGFTDCLLQRGAAHVHAVDTGYGTLAWKLRQDDRVTTLERTNALHMQDVERPASVDLVVIDLAWTRQCYAIPAALEWRPKHIITLIKPHYEQDAPEGGGGRGAKKNRPILSEEQSQEICNRVLEELAAMGGGVDGVGGVVEVLASIKSPVLGGKGKKHKGNVEYLAHLRVL